MASKVARITSTQEAFVQSKNVSESSAKARWNDSNTETFLKVCVEEVVAGNIFPSLLKASTILLILDILISKGF
ncbi:hypothetical protein K1719_046042 [Acacia pycnantha]|nr:hypothetical protein K1719_046042 [Acacia pycnantha]